VHGAHEALRHAGTLEHLLDALADQRGERGRLQHYPVARHQRDRHLAERDRPGVVPGRDDADHPERLEGEAGALLLDEDGQLDALVLEDAGARLGQPAQRVDGGHELHRVRLVDRLALLAREQGGEVVELVDDGLAGPAHVAGAVVQRQLGPEGLDARHVVHDRLDLLGPDGLDRAEPGAVERAE
jgi:hypothetical protein